MKRKKAIKRGRAIPILAAAGIGYLIGNWHAAALQGKEPSGTQSAAATVALRFPRDLRTAPVVQMASYAAAENPADDAQLAIFEPEPMVPTAASLNAVSQTAALTSSPIGVSAAAQASDGRLPEETADIAPLPPAPAVSRAVVAPVVPKPISVAKVRSTPPHHRAKRAGDFLDDAQIADIKRRLHLTPDQERMWPAVEAALRNIGAERAREARWRGTKGAIDPNSPQVEDLKSAAIPLLMSFSDDQKDEVRNLARNMGLNQLASEF
ncbi:MAG: hypothetical protein ACRECE_08745 [Xanthobacteraceae bacterium]